MYCLPNIPIYVDSALSATHLTGVSAEHRGVRPVTDATVLSKGEILFRLRVAQIKFVSSVQESMVLNRQEKAQIVIAASGMCEAGEILTTGVSSTTTRRNTILIVGFMAHKAPWAAHRRPRPGLRAGRNRVRRAPVCQAARKRNTSLRPTWPEDRRFRAPMRNKDEMRQFPEKRQSNLWIKQIALVHGEEVKRRWAFAEELNIANDRVVVPRRGETVEVRRRNDPWHFSHADRKQRRLREGGRRSTITSWPPRKSNSVPNFCRDWLRNPAHPEAVW